MTLTDNEQFEIKARAFFMLTGILAPGKDDPLEFDRQTRLAAFQQWNQANGPLIHALMLSFDEHVRSAPIPHS